MKLTEKNFTNRLKALEKNQYFTVETNDGYSIGIGRVNQIADIYIVGYWDLSSSIKIFPAPTCAEFDDFGRIEEETRYKQVYDYVLSEIDSEMNIISNIKEF